MAAVRSAIHITHKPVHPSTHDSSTKSRKSGGTQCVRIDDGGRRVFVGRNDAAFTHHQFSEFSFDHIGISPHHQSTFIHIVAPMVHDFIADVSPRFRGSDELAEISAIGSSRGIEAASHSFSRRDTVPADMVVSRTVFFYGHSDSDQRPLFRHIVAAATEAASQQVRMVNLKYGEPDMDVSHSFPLSSEAPEGPLDLSFSVVDIYPLWGIADVLDPQSFLHDVNGMRKLNIAKRNANGSKGLAYVRPSRRSLASMRARKSSTRDDAAEVVDATELREAPRILYRQSDALEHRRTASAIVTLYCVSSLPNASGVSLLHLVLLPPADCSTPANRIANQLSAVSTTVRHLRGTDATDVADKDDDGNRSRNRNDDESLGNTSFQKKRVPMRESPVLMYLMQTEEYYLQHSKSLAQQRRQHHNGKDGIDALSSSLSSRHLSDASYAQRRSQSTTGNGGVPTPQHLQTHRRYSDAHDLSTLSNISNKSSGQLGAMIPSAAIAKHALGQVALIMAVNCDVDCFSHVLSACLFAQRAGGCANVDLSQNVNVSDHYASFVGQRGEGSFPSSAKVEDVQALQRSDDSTHLTATRKPTSEQARYHLYEGPPDDEDASVHDDDVDAQDHGNVSWLNPQQSAISLHVPSHNTTSFPFLGLSDNSRGAADASLLLLSDESTNQNARLEVSALTAATHRSPGALQDNTILEDKSVQADGDASQFTVNRSLHLPQSKPTVATVSTQKSIVVDEATQTVTAASAPPHSEIEATSSQRRVFDDLTDPESSNPRSPPSPPVPSDQSTPRPALSNLPLPVPEWKPAVWPPVAESRRPSEPPSEHMNRSPEVIVVPVEAPDGGDEEAQLMEVAQNVAAMGELCDEASPPWWRASSRSAPRGASAATDVLIETALSSEVGHNSQRSSLSQPLPSSLPPSVRPATGVAESSDGDFFNFDVPDIGDFMSRCPSSAAPGRHLCVSNEASPKSVATIEKHVTPLDEALAPVASSSSRHAADTLSSPAPERPAEQSLSGPPARSTYYAPPAALSPTSTSSSSHAMLVERLYSEQQQMLQTIRQLDRELRESRHQNTLLTSTVSDRDNLVKSLASKLEDMKNHRTHAEDERVTSHSVSENFYKAQLEDTMKRHQETVRTLQDSMLVLSREKLAMERQLIQNSTGSPRGANVSADSLNESVSFESTYRERVSHLQSLVESMREKLESQREGHLREIVEWKEKFDACQRELVQLRSKTTEQERASEIRKVEEAMRHENAIELRVREALRQQVAELDGERRLRINLEQELFKLRLQVKDLTARLQYFEEEIAPEVDSSIKELEDHMLQLHAHRQRFRQSLRSNKAPAPLSPNALSGNGTSSVRSPNPSSNPRKISLMSMEHADDDSN